MATQTRITLNGHKIRFIRQKVGGSYRNVYKPHVGTNGVVSRAFTRANRYVETMFAAGLSRMGSVGDFKTFKFPAPAPAPIPVVADKPAPAPTSKALGRLPPAFTILRDIPDKAINALSGVSKVFTGKLDGSPNILLAIGVAVLAVIFLKREG